MSKMYEKIKEYYNTGLWSKERVTNMVVKGIITEEEYASIVGQEYEEKILLFCSILPIKECFLSKGLVASVASGATLSITNGTNTWTLEANS